MPLVLLCRTFPYMILHGQIRAASDWWFSKKFADQDWIGSGLDSNWKNSQSAHLCRRHLEPLRKKLTSRVALLRQLAGSPDLGCRRTTLSLARRAMEPGHLLHSTLTCPSSANQRWADCQILRSRSSPDFLKLSPSPTTVQKFFSNVKCKSKWSPKYLKNAFSQQKSAFLFH